MAPATIAVAVLSLIALALRLSQIHQSLYGDELFTLQDITGRGFGAVLTTVNTGGENSPPLFFVLAWLSAKLGDPTVWIRLFSVVLGAAVVPLVYVLGRETVGRAAALIGAAMVALSPFTVYYGSEARPYTTLTFLLVLSTIALVKATRTGARRWWCLYTLAAAAAAYTHYTGIFVLGAQGLWSLWVCRDRLRTPLIANAAVVVLYLPWLPNLRGKDLQVIGGLYPLHPGVVVRDAIRAVIGYPSAGLGAIPTKAGIAAIGVCALAGLIALVVRSRRSAPGAWRIDPSSPTALITALALATPIGLLLYSVLVTDLWLPRGLSASIPAEALLLGMLLSKLPRRWTAVTAVVVLVTLVAGTIKSFSSDYVREPFRQMASDLDRLAAPGDPVLMGSLIAQPAIAAQSQRPLRFVKVTLSSWRLTPRGGLAFLVLAQDLRQRIGLGTLTPAGLKLVSIRHYPGSQPTDILIYRRS